MIEKLREMFGRPMDQVEFLTYVLSGVGIGTAMSLWSVPWWCYIPPTALLVYAGVERYRTVRQVPGKHRK